MAEILVCLTSRIGATIYHDVCVPKRGDILEVRSDGWNWSKSERSNPQWTIVKVLDTDVEELAFLMSSERSNSWLAPIILHMRHKTLNIDDSRFSNVMSLATVQALTSFKSSVDDPTVIGSSHNVLG